MAYSGKTIMSDQRQNIYEPREIAFELSRVIWNFKIGDNVIYNFKILNSLLIQRNVSGTLLLNKPIVIISSSIIEALIIDFISRLDGSTNDFPTVARHFMGRLKIKFSEDKQRHWKKDKDHPNKLPNYGWNEMVDFLKTHAFLGFEDSFYDVLHKIGHLRNRIHIQNYYSHFEVDEHVVFSTGRVSKVLIIMKAVLDGLYFNYPRQCLSEDDMNKNYNVWLENLTKTH